MHGKKVHGIDDFFQAIDTDGSQFVDRDELSKGLQLLDITVSDDQLAQLVTVMDPNGNQKISYFELKGELHKQARLVPPPVRARADLFLLGCLADMGRCQMFAQTLAATEPDPVGEPEPTADGGGDPDMALAMAELGKALPLRRKPKPPALIPLTAEPAEGGVPVETALSELPSVWRPQTSRRRVASAA
jgi:hypothetical protein